MVSVKLDVAVSPPPSVTNNVIAVTPQTPLFGVNFTEQLPYASGGLITTLAFGTNAVLLDDPVTLSEAAGVTSSATENQIGEVAAVPTSMDLLSMDVIVGGAFTARAGALKEQNAR